MSTPYASVEELAALLKVNATTREDALTRALAAAAEEIDAELGRTEPFDDSTTSSRRLIT